MKEIWSYIFIFTNILEEGTHAQLMTLGGQYAQLFEVQSRYYREGAMEDEEIG